jgi:DNA-directed RNA polymerase subunit RPC12/RpoP
MAPQSNSLTFTCTKCSADLRYTPGQKDLVCEYCGATQDIQQQDFAIEEQDYLKHLSFQIEEDTIDVHIVTCDSCGATSTLEANTESGECPYCMTPLIIKNSKIEGLIRPKSLLPFKLKQNEAREKFKKWISSLWFAPSNLKKALTISGRLKGIYLPYWTYDTKTQSSYFGQRGDYYYTSETYTTTENGQTVTKTREVRHTRWSSASGHVLNTFDDVLVPGSTSLPERFLLALEPWDLANLVPFDEKYLSGFITEKYRTDLEQGFEKAKEIMKQSILRTVCSEIGGDEQRILELRTSYSSITFKHILLPVYVCAYKYKAKLYQFIVNARTGEIKGQRPWSWIKIGFTIVLGATIIGALVLYGSRA